MADKRVDIEIGVRKEGRGDEEAREGLRDLSAAAGEAQEQLDNLQIPSLDGLGEAAKAEAGKVADAAAAIAASGEDANKAGVNFGALSRTLSGLNQIKSDDVITQFKGLGSTLQSVASLGVGVLGPGSAFVGVIAAAAGAIGIIASAWEKESPEVLAEMDRLRTGAEAVKKDLTDLSNVKPNFESVIASIQEVYDEYKKMGEAADRSFELQKKTTDAKGQLDKANLFLSQERSVAAVPDEAKPFVREAFAERERQLNIEQSITRLTQDRENNARKLAQEIEKRALIQERLTVIDKEIERIETENARRRVQDAEWARAPISPIAGAMFPSDVPQLPISTLPLEKKRAEISLKLNEDGENLETIETKIAELKQEIENLDTQIQAVEVSAQAMDITALPKAEAAISALAPFLQSAQEAVSAAAASGENIPLQDALKQLRDLQAVMSDLRGAVPQTGEIGDVLKRAAESIENGAEALQNAAPPLDEAANGVESGAQALTDAAAAAAAALAPALDPMAVAIREGAANLEQNLAGSLEAPAAALESGAQALTDAAAAAAAALAPALDPVAGALREGAANLEQNLSGSLEAPAAALESGVQAITDAAANAGASVSTEGAAAANALRTAGSEIGASVGALGAEAKKGANDAVAKIEEIGARLAADLQTGAQRIDGDAAAFQDRVGQSIQGMTTSVDSMGREVVRAFDEITARINIIAAQSRNAMQLADLALQQVLNS